MINHGVIYTSYLLRIWHIKNATLKTHDREWVCEVVSVHSGETWKIKSLAALFKLLEELSNKNEF